MKNTYLIYKDKDAENKELIVATKEQWNAILKTNRGLPSGQRRFFICDSFEDCGEIDRMFIETTKAEYNVWHSQYVTKERNRKIGQQFAIVSTEQEIDDELTFNDVISDDFNLEEIACDEMLIEGLRKVLWNWRGWANEMLDFYLDGCKKSSTEILSKKYNVSAKTIRERKRDFEKFVIRFLKKTF